MYLTIFDLPINHCLKTSLVNTFDDNRRGARWTVNVIARDFRALSEAEITARRGDTRQISIRASRRAAQDWMPYCIYRASRIIFNGVAFLACTHIPRLSPPPPTHPVKNTLFYNNILLVLSPLRCSVNAVCTLTLHSVLGYPPFLEDDASSSLFVWVQDDIDLLRWRFIFLFLLNLRVDIWDVFNLKCEFFWRLIHDWYLEFVEERIERISFQSAILFWSQCFIGSFGIVVFFHMESWNMDVEIFRFDAWTSWMVVPDSEVSILTSFPCNIEM